MTRLAGGAPSMWTAIVEDNGVALEGALDALEQQLRVFRETLRRHDTASTNAIFTTGRAWFDGETAHGG
jgi:prephenate dehydrogenase